MTTTLSPHHEPCPRPLRRRALGILLCVVIALGCNGELTTSRPSDSDRDGLTEMEKFLGPPNITVSPVQGDDPAAGPARTIYMIYMRIGTIEVPTGMISGSEQLWSYLDEEPTALYSSVLGLNGFRVGLGRPEAWDDLQRVIKRMTGRHFKAQALQLFSGRPGVIELKGSQGVQTIFTYFDDETLSGADYPPGDNLLVLGATLDRGETDRVILTALPQIRSARKQSQLTMEHGMPTYKNLPVLFPFRSLTFQVTIPEGYFLVIGPGIRSRRPTSVANHFLTLQREGLEYETLLILHPTVFPIEYSGSPEVPQSPSR